MTMIMAANEQAVPETNGNFAGEPIDWEHLAKYTLGNKTVEKEVLALFSRQSSQYLDKLKSAANAQAWKEAAHTIKGSARGVGAWRVAAKAEALEMLGEQAFTPAGTTAIAALEQNILEVIGYIARVLEDK